MTATDLIAWLAAALTLLTFSMRSMVALRIAAVSANLCFLAYGVGNELYPVMVLHSLLLPCNLFRLCQLYGADAEGVHRVERLRGTLKGTSARMR